MVLIDTLPNDLTPKADVLLPGATWAEKSGTFENVAGRLQAFVPAISVMGLNKPEGQIALDLMAACGVANPSGYDAAAVRLEMGGVFETDVHRPSQAARQELEMEYVEL